jgi:hypothetical protein
LTHVRLNQIARHFAVRVPEVNLEGERVLPRPAVEQPLQRRIGYKSAIPIVFTVDLSGWGNRAAESRWRSHAPV